MRRRRGGASTSQGSWRPCNARAIGLSFVWLSVPSQRGAAARRTAAGKPAEAALEPFLGEPRFDVQPVFQGERFPNVVVATDGTVLATWGSQCYRVRRSEDGGKTWQTSAPFPAFGTGEGTVTELSDGRIYYNSRRHWAPEGQTNLMRHIALDGKRTAKGDSHQN